MCLLALLALPRVFARANLGIMKSIVIAYPVYINVPNVQGILLPVYPAQAPIVFLLIHPAYAIVGIMMMELTKIVAV